MIRQQVHNLVYFRADSQVNNELLQAILTLTHRGQSMAHTPEASALRKRLMHFTLQKLKKEFRMLKASMTSVLCQIHVLNIVS